MKAGYVSLIGRPNVGKSTLLNSLIGQKISIVSRKPQTTRNRILGIKNLSGVQLVFLDTPGVPDIRGTRIGKKLLNQTLAKTALASVRGVDIIVHIIAQESGSEGQEDAIMSELKKIHNPIVLAINKVDILKDKSVLLPLMETYYKSGMYREIVPISALTGEGLDNLQNILVRLCPEGERFFPEDMVTEESERFLVQEIVRESIVRFTSEEVPYSTAVAVDTFREQPDKNIIFIGAVIYVERLSQKGIIIGKHGQMLKKIGTQARQEIEAILGSKVFLDLWVKVREGWTDDPASLKDFGYL